MNNRSKLFCLLFTLFLWPALGQKQVYDIEDLKVLNAQNSFYEFLIHAKDIRPSQRDINWKKMVKQMAMGHIDYQYKTKNFQKSTFEFIDKLAAWPSLSTDEFFHIKRNKYSLAYFKHCLIESKSNCEEQIFNYWSSSNKDIETAYQLNLLLSGFKPNTNDWRITKDIVNSKLSSFYCNKETVVNSLLTQLNKRIGAKASLKEVKKQIDLITSNSCKEVLFPIIKGLVNNSHPKTSHLAFKILISNELLSQEEKDIYFVEFILKNPEQGDILNIAWNEVKSISSDYSRRVKVLEKLKGNDPLLDQIFGDENIDKAITFINHISTYIPEYMDYYAKECLDYLEGKKVFITGNPTPNCRKLFTIQQNHRWINQSLKIRYSGLKKF